MLLEDFNWIEEVEDWIEKELGYNDRIHLVDEALLHGFPSVLQRNGFHKGTNQRQSNGGIEPSENGDFDVKRGLLSMLCGMRLEIVDELTTDRDNDVGLITKKQRESV